MAEAVTERLAALVGKMRAAGVPLGVGDLLAAHRALAAVDASSREESYLALRAVLCARRSHYALFDSAFEEVFAAPVGVADDALAGEFADVAKLVLPRAAMPAVSAMQASAPEDAELVPAAWSDVELLRHKDFAEMTEVELAAARRIVRRLAPGGPFKRSRRTRPARHRGSRPDLRRTVRASMRYGGEPVERHWRAPSRKHRPVVLVCDVSGSMEPYARMLVQYMQAWVAARRRVEAFAFGTRLTHLTRELEGRDAAGAVQRAAAAVADWSGGTRIGESLGELNRRYGRRIGRGSVVVVLSDGWDRGDPDRLADEMARLSRCAHSLIWLNPLKAHPGYEPLTRGMTAALPHVSHFLAGNSIASLEELAALLEEGLE